MVVAIAPIILEREVRFDNRHPVGVHLTTTLPGQVLLIGMRAGQRLRDHRVNTPITIHVLRGEGTITVEKAAYPVQAGAFLSVASNAVHDAAAESDLVLLVHRAATAEAEALESDAAPVGDTAEEAGDVRRH
jgi:quercetin dioxygenase-like cupin family protein